MFKFAIGLSAVVLASCAAAPAYAGEVEDKDASLAICRSEMKIRIEGMSDRVNKSLMEVFDGDNLRVGRGLMICGAYLTGQMDARKEALGI